MRQMGEADSSAPRKGRFEGTRTLWCPVTTTKKRKKRENRRERGERRRVEDAARGVFQQVSSSDSHSTPTPLLLLQV